MGYQPYLRFLQLATRDKEALIVATRQQKVDAAKVVLQEDIELIKLRRFLEDVRIQMARDGVDATRSRKVFDSVLREFGLRIVDTDS